jgi:hypothetical protein
MISITNAARSGIAILSVALMGACGSNGGLGNVLGGLPGQAQGDVSGTVERVNGRNQQISLRQPDGRSITLDFDNQTQVVYQNQNYAVNNLENGDRVTARIINSNNGRYYTDLIQVDRSVSGDRGSINQSNVQRFEGTVRQIDYSNGLFTLSGTNYGNLTVSLPYNPRRTDADKFNRLRSGDYVRFYGYLLNNNRVELQQFN